MGSLPVYSVAGSAGFEVGVLVADAFGQPRLDLRSLDRHQKFVAAQATLERGNRSQQVKPAKHLHHLVPRAGLPDPIPMGYGAPLEQISIAREQDPSLPLGHPGQFAIGRIILEKNIEAEHSQVSRQAPEVHIEYETRLAKRLRAHPGDRSDVDRLEHRVDTYPATAGHRPAEADRPPAEKSQGHPVLRTPKGLAPSPAPG